jgi:2-polyprenyl-3-methyl-5-hydroxy-6-metoxy-1,4-benzoquinol methylase
MKEKVLDVGCWSGKKVKELLDEGYDAYGMDITDEHFKEAPKKVQKRLGVGDITNIIKIKPEQFDVIYLTEVLEHLGWNDELALENIDYLLKKEGALILSTPKSIPFLEFWDPAWIKWKMGLGEKHYHYSEEELLEKLEDAGFDYYIYTSTGGMKWLFYRWLNTILKNGFGMKKQFICEKGEGYFDWEVMAIK